MKRTPLQTYHSDRWVIQGAFACLASKVRYMNSKLQGDLGVVKLEILTELRNIYNKTKRP